MHYCYAIQKYCRHIEDVETQFQSGHQSQNNVTLTLVSRRTFGEHLEEITSGSRDEHATHVTHARGQAVPRNVVALGRHVLNGTEREHLLQLASPTSSSHQTLECARVRLE